MDLLSLLLLLLFYPAARFIKPDPCIARWLQKNFGITHIELSPMSKPWWAPKHALGTLDLVNNLLVLTHLLTDQF
jgi:hypothetical protein